MKTYWQSLLLLSGVSLLIDYWIADSLANSEEDKWFLFVLIIVVPILFSMKSAVSRVIVFFFFSRQKMIEEILQTLRSEHFAVPDEFDIGDAENYLASSIADENRTVDERIKSAIGYGVVLSMNQNGMILGKLFWNSGFKEAMKRYREVHQ